MNEEKIKEIVSVFGNKDGMAKYFGVSNAAVSGWFSLGLPASRAIDIERATGGRFLACDIVGIRYDSKNEK